MSRSLVLIALVLALVCGAIAFLLLDQEVGASEDHSKGGTAAADVRKDARDETASSSADSARDQAGPTKPEEPKPSVAGVTGQSEEEAQRGAFVVKGQVVGPDRKPIANAEVTLARPGYGGATALSVLALSKPDGKFVIGAPERSGWGWHVEARSSGFAATEILSINAWSGELDLGVLVLYPPSTLSGRVLDREGRPIAGAKIYVRSRSEEIWSDEWMEDNESAPAKESQTPKAVSAADGSYAVSNLPVGRVTFGAEAAGFADAVRPNAVLKADGSNTMDLILQPEDPLSGIVVDEQGSTLEKVRVAAGFQDARRAFWRQPAATDPQGRFTIRGLPTSRQNINVTLRKLGYGMVWMEGMKLPADERYTLKKVTTFLVRAQAAEGAPKPVIRTVGFESRRKNNSYSGVNEIDRSQRQVLAPDQWKIQMEGSGMRRIVVTTVSNEVGRSQEFDPKNLTAETEIVAVLDRLGSVTGKVQKSDLTPVAGVTLEINLIQRNQYSGGAPITAISAADGTFAFPSAPPGASNITIRSKDWVSNPVKVEVAAGEKREGVELVVTKASRIVGTVKVGGKAPGEPIPIAVHQVKQYEHGVNWNFLSYVTTNEAGEYITGPVPSGRIALVPKRPTDTEDGSTRTLDREIPNVGWGERAAQWPWIVETPAEGEARLDIDMPVTRPSIVKGHVSINGEGRAGLQLWASNEQGDEWNWDTTAADGRFRFRLNTAGQVTVQLWGEGFNESRQISVAEGEEREVNFDLSSGGIEGQVADPSGVAVVAQVRLERQRDKGNDNGWSWNMPEMLTKGNGSYTFEEIPAGSYRAVATDPKRRYATVASEVFTLSAREKLQVPLLRMPIASPLLVVARDPEGKPVSGRVTITAPPGSEPLARKSVSATVRSGAARVYRLRPGPLTVKFTANNPKQWIGGEQTVTLGADGSEVMALFEVKRREEKSGSGAPSENSGTPVPAPMVMESVGYLGSSAAIEVSGGHIVYSGGMDAMEGEVSWVSSSFGPFGPGGGSGDTESVPFPPNLPPLPGK